MFRIFLLLLLIFPTFSWAGGCAYMCHAEEVKVNEKVIDTAREYLHVREAKNNNDHPEITKWLKYTGLGGGYPYCQAFVVWTYHETFEDIGHKSPLPRTARVAHFAEYSTKNPLTFKVISTKKIRWGIDTPEIGDIASWKHGSSTFTGFGYAGHTGFVVSVDKNLNIYTIEGNTKAGEGGDQSGTIKGDMTYGHEGVYERKRRININSKFPIMYFIRLQKREYEKE